jgi:nucleoside-diphosphate-sugar epimerase
MTADEEAPFAERLVARWAYYVSKIRAEREARRLAHQLGVELVIVRPPVLLGLDDHNRLSTGCVQKVLDASGGGAERTAALAPPGDSLPGSTIRRRNRGFRRKLSRPGSPTPIPRA